MVKKGMTKERIMNEFYWLRDNVIYGDWWVLMEHKEYGDDYPCIAVNRSQGFYVYTFDSLEETVLAMDGFTEIYKFATE